MRVINYLYVEDNQELRESVCALVADSRREVIAVASAEAALRALDNRPFDVLITDLDLPGMSGTELARLWLKPDPARWLVLCSGGDVRQGLEPMGPKLRVLQKSFEIEELEALLDEIEADLTRENQGGR